MTDTLNLVFAGWRTDIAGELVGAEAELAAAIEAEAEARAIEEEDATERRRINAAVRKLASNGPLSSVLARRIADIRPNRHGVSSAGHRMAADSSRARIADLREALAQLDALLAPPAAATADEAAPAEADFTDIIQFRPARAAGQN